MQLREVLKTRGHFPSDEIIYLAIRNITKEVDKSTDHASWAGLSLPIQFGERFFARLTPPRKR